MNNAIVWDGFTIVFLVLLGVLVVCTGLAWVLVTIQEKIDKYFERRNKDDE